MSRARHEIPHRRRPLLLAAGIVGIVMVAGLAVWQIGSRDDSGAQPEPTLLATADATGNSGPEPTAAPPTTAPPTTATRTPAEACAREIATTQAVEYAARIAATHWREHVQARTDLLAGRNSEAATKAIWKRTRLAGPADIARLGAAATEQRKADGGCAKLTGTSVVACRQRLAALDAAASAGRAAAADWASHLAMMAAHAAGDFDAEHAQHMWVAAWTAAPKNLNAWARAEAAVAKAPACRPS